MNNNDEMKTVNDNYVDAVLLLHVSDLAKSHHHVM